MKFHALIGLIFVGENDEKIKKNYTGGPPFFGTPEDPIGMRYP